MICLSPFDIKITKKQPAQLGEISEERTRLFQMREQANMPIGNNSKTNTNAH